jgi:hypothetical protein
MMNFLRTKRYQHTMRTLSETPVNGIADVHTLKGFPIQFRIIDDRTVIISRPVRPEITPL